MDLKILNKRPAPEHNSRLKRTYDLFNILIDELRKKELPNEIVSFINKDIDLINSIPESDKKLKKQIRGSQSRILKRIEKELKLVTKNHYRNTWLAIGMAVFGIPFGVAFGASLGNMAFIGIGLPIGMAIGIAIGTSMDAKARENGKQLDLEINY